MMKEKLTRKDYFEILRGLAEDAGNTGAVEFCEHQIELLDKKKGTSRGMTATQKENIGIMDTIVEVLKEMDAPVKVSELTKDVRLPYSGQKISALLKKLKDEGRVENIKEGKNSFFSAI